MILFPLNNLVFLGFIYNFSFGSAIIHSVPHDDPRISYIPTVCDLDCTRVCRNEWWLSCLSDGSASHRTKGNNTSSNFNFRGGSITWYTRMDPNGGKAIVWIDSAQPESVDTHSSTTVESYAVFNKAGLDPTLEHLITIVYDNSSFVEGTERFVDVHHFEFDDSESASTLNIQTTSSTQVIPTIVSSTISYRRLGMGSIIGIVCGVSGCLLAMTVLLWYFKRRKRAFIGEYEVKGSFRHHQMSELDDNRDNWVYQRERKTEQLLRPTARQNRKGTYPDLCASRSSVFTEEFTQSAIGTASSLGESLSPPQQASTQHEEHEEEFELEGDTIVESEPVFQRESTFQPLQGPRSRKREVMRDQLRAVSMSLSQTSDTDYSGSETRVAMCHKQNPMDLHRPG